jgi:hypothetical protein
VEEARQHPALNAEEWFFATVFIAGPLSLLIGFVLTVAGYKVMVIALLIHAFSRVTISVWATARPMGHIQCGSTRSRTISGLVWAVVAAILIWVEIET